MAEVAISPGVQRKMVDIPVLCPREVERRMDWARRRGLSRWLWPDISPQAWRQGLAAIADVATQVLAGHVPSEPLSGDPTVLSLAAFTSGMGPLLGYWVEAGQLSASADVACMLRAHLSHNRRRTKQVQDYAVRVVELLNANGVCPTILKGAHTAFTYFPVPEVRPLTDVDLVVLPEQLQDAERIFAQAGYVRELRCSVPYGCDWMVAGNAKLPKTLLCVHAEDPWAFDLQTTLNRYLDNNAVVRLDDFRNDAAGLKWRLSNAAAVLGQPLLTLQLAAHASQIRLSLTLIRLVELILVIRKDSASGVLSWAKFLVALKKLGPRFVYPALYFAEKLAPGTIPKTVFDICEADAPPLLRKFVSRQNLSTLQGLERHSLLARYMWADSWVGGLGQLAREFMPPSNRPYTRSEVRSMYISRIMATLHLGR